MNADWQEFLTAQGGLERAAVEADCALSDLSHLGLIRVTGEDARTLLQGQLTNDINLVTTEKSQLSAICNPKGRMFTCFHIFEREDGLYLQLNRAVLEPVLKRLGMFVLMSKAEISNASDDLVSIGVTGECANELIDDLPAGPFNSLNQNELTIIRHPGDVPRAQLTAPVAVIKQCWEKLSKKATIVNTDFWPLADIRAGIPSIYTATMESFIPQMLNLELVEGVSFTKGCFTGQEVVARMHYLGKSKRRMYRANIMTEKAPLPGEELFSPSSKSGQGPGNIVDARPSPTGGYEALVVAQTSSMTTADLRLDGENGPEVKLLEPPYSLENE